MTGGQGTRQPGAQQPSSKHCFVCGVANPHGLHLRFFDDGPLRVQARVVLDDAFQSYPGAAHGGILATILDETMGRAILSTDSGEPRFMFTARLEVRYRQPVPLHQEVIARGWVDKDRGRMVQVSGEIVLPDGTVAVEASATLVEIAAEQVQAMLTEDVGWQVYPDA